MKIVIENLERYSEWLMLEYKHAVEIWEEKILFTNVKDDMIYEEISKIAECKRDSIIEIGKGKKCIVLDPYGKKKITQNDFTSDYIIIGGILGDKEFTGKTKKMITDRGCMESRHLGKIQLSIDISAFIAKLVCLGKELDDIEFAYELEIDYGDGSSTILPYGYPIIDDKVIITPGLIDYLIESR